MTVWNEPGVEVDVVMDLKNLTFREGMVEEIYAFHVLEHFFPSEIPVALANWRKCLTQGRELYIVSDDFEFLSRAFLGGEINIDALNTNASYPTKITRDNLLSFLKGVGFNDNEMRLWYVDVPNLFKKQDFEIVVSSKKV